MNWQTELLHTDPEPLDASADTRGKRGKARRMEAFRHAFKVRKSRAKSSWKKIAKRFRQPLGIAVGLLILGMVVGVAMWFSSTRNNRRETSLVSLLPGSSEPTLPVFEEESIATDPKAAVRRWRYIVVHHSAGTSGSAQSFDAYHRDVRHWQSLGYHFVIGNGKGQGDGKVAPGPRWYEQQAGAHAHSAEHNEFGIGICLVGNFDAQEPTPAQWRALVDLIKRLSTRYNIAPANIVGHSQIRQGGTTACPGKNLNMQALRAAVQNETR